MNTLKQWKTVEYSTVPIMKRLTLLLGLLTYSSVGWSESLIMECFVDDQNYGKSSIGIFKMETEESESSGTLLTKRSKGKWKEMCVTSCEKGDLSVVVQRESGDDVFDFRFNRYSEVKRLKGREGLELEIQKGKCERIN